MKTRLNYQVFPFLISVVLQGCTGDGWEPLYNGKNLDGWHVECKPEDKSRDFWTSKGEYIECNSLGQSDHNYVWLMSDKEYDNFDLKLEFQIFTTVQGNSGMQFRSRYDRSDTASGGGWLNGPQVDIHPPSSFRTGLIYDETRGVQRWIYPSLPDWEITPDDTPGSAHQTILYYADKDPEAWNSFELICNGMEIQTIINGNPVAQYDATGILDDENHQAKGVGTKGYLAFQLHNRDELLIRFRNIFIRETGE